MVLVDDQSSDGTAGGRFSRGARGSAGDRLQVVAGTAPPSGWTGKLWAMQQGLAAIEARRDPSGFVLFSDADIRYAPQALLAACRDRPREAEAC